MITRISNKLETKTLDSSVVLDTPVGIAVTDASQTVGANTLIYKSRTSNDAATRERIQTRKTIPAEYTEFATPNETHSDGIDNAPILSPSDDDSSFGKPTTLKAATAALKSNTNGTGGFVPGAKNSIPAKAMLEVTPSSETNTTDSVI
ncbi:MAG: hypothetical protein EOM41_08210 [Bacilli bacterium]|nr:hypothetical protein [Bacilli bacterium]